MKRIFFLLFLILLSIFLFIFNRHQGIVPGIKDSVIVKSQQYYGVTVDMSQILPQSKHYIVNSKGQDLIDIASSLGMNTLRITNITSISDAEPTAYYSYTQWADVLNKMQKKGMYALVLVEGNSQDTFFHDITIRDYYVNFVRNYIQSGVCNFPNVIGIDIANEPTLNTYNLTHLKQASQIVKATCPNTKVTIGSWRVDSGQRDDSGNIIYNWHDPKEVRQINDIVDMVSVHIYGFDKPKDGPYPDPYKLTIGYLNEIEKYTSKPIFIEEFGAGNGSGLTDQNTIGSPEIQKKAYEGVLKAARDFKNKGLLGATSYLFISRSDHTDSWSILENKGDTLLPAVFTFQPL